MPPAIEIRFPEINLKSPPDSERFKLVTQVDQMWNSIVEGVVRIDQAIDDYEMFEYSKEGK